MLQRWVKNAITRESPEGTAETPTRFNRPQPLREEAKELRSCRHWQGDKLGLDAVEKVSPVFQHFFEIVRVGPEYLHVDFSQAALE